MSALWAAAFAVPLAMALAMAAVGLTPGRVADAIRDVLCRFGWVAVLPAGALVWAGDDVVRRIDWMLLGTRVELDTVGRPLLAMAAVLYGLALAFVPRSRTEHAPALSGMLFVCFAGNAGVFVAADLITFYLSFTVMSFVGYALVVHDRSGDARRAGRIYLVMTVLGEGAVLAAMVMVASAGGVMLADAPAAVAGHAQRDLIIALLLIGFGIKAGTVPLHVWLPLAHPAAPTPASAVLSGVMIKAGLVGWLRFLPLGEGSGSPGWGTTFVLLALVGGFLAVPVGLLQDNAKVILAYSSISQMGFMAVLVGVALAEPELAGACVLAAVVYAVHHGLAKGALFLGVQAWATERLPRPVVAAGMGVAGLSIIGAPFTSGYVAKYGAKEATGAATFPVDGGTVELADVLPWVGLGSTLLLARFAVVMWARGRRRDPTSMWRDLAWVVVAAGAAVPVAALARTYDPPQTVPGWLDPSTLWDQSWPLLLGVVLAVVAARLARRAEFDDSKIAHPHGDMVPPGDVVAIEERVLRAVGRQLMRLFDLLGAGTARVREWLAAIPSPLPALGAAQARIGSWAGSGSILLLLMAASLIWSSTRGS